jgi:hypothetical protein
MAPSKELAPSAPPVKFKPHLSVNQSVTSVSRATVAKANTIAPQAMTAGKNQKLERTRFHVLKTCTLMMTPFHSFAGPARPNEEFSGRASMSTASHRAFAEMSWPFAHAEMLGINYTLYPSANLNIAFWINPFSKFLKATYQRSYYNHSLFVPNLIKFNAMHYWYNILFLHFDASDKINTTNMLLINNDFVSCFETLPKTPNRPN